MTGDVYLVDLDATRPTCDDLTGLRVFAGYAGWSPGQLAGEIVEGAWACVPGSPDDVLSALAGPELWRAGDGPPGRPSGRAVDRPARSHGQLRVPGRLRIW